MSLSIGGFNSNVPNPGMDPDSYAKQYATQHGISLEQAKAELKEKYGDPGQAQVAQKENIFSNTQKVQPIGENMAGKGFDSELLALGIPQNIINQGKNAVEEYADKNNITLPTPPEHPKVGGKLNIMM